MKSKHFIILGLPAVIAGCAGLYLIVSPSPKESPPSTVQPAKAGPAVPTVKNRPAPPVPRRPEAGAQTATGMDDHVRRSLALGEKLVSSERSLEIARYVAQLDLSLIPTLLKHGGDLDGELKGALLQRWTDVAPRDALSHACSLGDEDERAGNITWMMERWSRTSLADARAMAESLPAGRDRQAAIGALIPELAKVDRQGALVLLGGLPATEAPVPAGQMFREWARSGDAAGAFAAAQSLVGGTRFAALQATLQVVAPEDPERAAELWLALPVSKDRSDLLPTLTQAMAAIDPKAAVEWAAYHASGAGAQQAVGEALGEWMKADPDAAQTWVLARGPKAQQDDLHAYAASAIAGVKPQLAMQLAQSVGSEDERNAALRGAADSWSRRDPDGFRDWLLRQTDAATLAAVVPAAVGQAAASDPATAAGWVSQFGAGPVRDAATRRLISGWTAVDPRAAANWSLQNITPGWERTQALGLSVAAMMESSPAQAESFAAGLPGGIERDNVIEFAAERIAVRDPLAALRAAGTIADEAKRHVVLQQAFQSYHQLAPAEADAWLASANIPADIKQKFQPLP